MGKDTIILTLILFNIFFIAFVAGLIIFIRQYRLKKRTHDKELETIDLLHKKELLKTKMEIQKQTMKHIGREIHDNIGQKLTLSSMYLQQLVFENKTQEITDNINNINDIINDSLEDLRGLSKSLTDDSVENNSISELIEVECEKVSLLKTHNVIFNSNLDILLTSYRSKSILLRIAQEFLQNSIKHADCKIIEISICNTDDSLLLVLKDDGKGFDTKNKKHKGIGLVNMQKRVEIINGKFNLESDNINGTKLTVYIPL